MRTNIKTDTRWVVSDIQPVPEELAGFDFVTAQLLLQRQINTKVGAEEFLRPDLANLGDLHQLADLDRAVERIKQAITQKQVIVVYGDYDVDGVTSATLLSNVLKELGATVSVYLPERLTEGYGLNSEAIRQLKTDGTDLIITVDNGTTNVTEIALANSLGLEVIVVDHHQVPAELPPAYALINPKRADDKYPFKDAAAVGVTYYLAKALIGDGANKYLDLVALGTVADVVPLVGDNRAMVVAGLRQMNEKTRPGIAVLKEVAGLKDQALDVYHIGFQLGPRLNAAGRIDHARIAFDLLNAESEEIARPLAQELDALNTRRQEMTDRILEETKTQATESQDKIIIVGGPDWSIGVVGIVAGRLVEEFFKPALVFEYQDEMYKGSGRSVEGVHLVDLLGKVGHLIDHFGGHAKAAGLSVTKDNFEKFRTELIKIANTEIDSALLTASLRVDVLLQINHVTPKLMATIEAFAPFGFGNVTPVFGVMDAELTGEMPGMNGVFLDLFFKDESGRALVVKVFGDWTALSLRLTQGAHYDIAFTMATREWNGRKFMQQKLVGIRSA